MLKLLIGALAAVGGMLMLRRRRKTEWVDVHPDYYDEQWTDDAVLDWPEVDPYLTDQFERNIVNRNGKR